MSIVNYYYYYYYYYYYNYYYYYYCYLINLAFCAGRFYTNFLPKKRVITNDQRFMGLLSISYVFKNLYFPILLHSFSPVQFSEQFPSPSPFAFFKFFIYFFFIKSPQPCFCKSYPQSKTSLNIRVVPPLIYELFSAVMQCL